MRSSRRRPTRLPRHGWLVVAATLLLAAGLRLTRLGLVEFKYDEATTARSALAIARESRLPVVGMVTSQGARNPALMSYVLAPPFAISRDPRLAAGWVGLLGVAAVGLTFWLGSTFFDWRVGAVAAVLFAASPWAVFQSRKIWTQNLPLVTLVFAGSVLAWAAHGRHRALTLAMASVGCLVGLHLGGLAFFLVLGTLLIVFCREVRPGPLLVGLGILALLLAPYAVYDARHGWGNVRALLDLGSAGAGLNLRAFPMAARVASGYRLQDLAGRGHSEFVSSLPRLLWIDQTEIALFWLGLVWAVATVATEAVARRGRLSTEGRARFVLLCWFLIPVTLLTGRTPVQPHDFNLLYPVQHLIIGLLLVDALDWLRSRLGDRAPRASLVAPGAVALVVAGIVVWQIGFQRSLLDFVDSHDTTGGHGAPVKYALTAARRAEELAALESAELIALLPGGNPRYDGSAAVFDVLLRSGDRRLVDGQQALPLPNRSAVLLAHPEASEAVSRLDMVTTEALPVFPVRGGSSEKYRFFLWQPAEVDLGRPVRAERSWALPGDPPSEPLASLAAYGWDGKPGPGRTLRWTIVWRVESEPRAGVDLHWFNHLVDQEGQRWAQADGVGLPTAEWRSGDTVASWFELSIPAEAPDPPYWVRTGLYTYPEVVNLPVFDDSRSPVGQFVELGPLDAE